MKGLDIAIVGAGISGLTCALACVRSGHRVRLYESALEWGDVGAGITLSPNAMRGLDYVGVGEDIARAGIEPSSQTICHWQNNSLIFEVHRQSTREQYGAAYVYIHRAELHKILTDAAARAGIKMFLGKTLCDVDADGERSKLRFTDGSETLAELLIGADGIKSQVRKLFAAQPPQFTGHVAYRAIAPVNSSIQELVDQPGMHIGPGKMVVRYPLCKGRLLNLVFFNRKDGWTEDGWSIRADIGELQAEFDGWCDEVQRLLLSAQEDTVFKWAINAHQPLTTWSKNNQVTMIGDSAHAMTPFLGQGAATGIEDAVVLSRSLEQSSSIELALQCYERERVERTNYILKESNANADRLQGQDAELYGIDDLVNEETLGLFDYNCVTVPLS